MRHLKALGIKLAVHIVWALVLFSLIYDIPVSDAIIAALIVAALIYVVGDLLILRRFGNIMATLVDAGTALLIVWVYLGSVLDGGFFTESLIFAVGVAIFEWFFHLWLLNNVVPDERRMR